MVQLSGFKSTAKSKSTIYCRKSKVCQKLYMLTLCVFSLTCQMSGLIPDEEGDMMAYRFSVWPVRCQVLPDEEGDMMAWSDWGRLLSTKGYTPDPLVMDTWAHCPYRSITANTPEGSNISSTSLYYTILTNVTWSTVTLWLHKKFIVSTVKKFSFRGDLYKK